MANNRARVYGEQWPSSTDSRMYYTNPAGIILPVAGSFGNGKVPTGQTDGSVMWATPSGGGGSGALVLLEQHAASASASLDFTAWYSASYDTYQIEVIDLVTSATTKVGFQASTNGGSSWVSGASDYDGIVQFGYSGGDGAENNLNKSRIALREGATTALQVNRGYNASFTLKSPGSSSMYKSIIGHGVVPDNSVGIIDCSYSGTIKTTTAINAFRFIPDSGTLTSGIVRVYGLAK